MEERLHKLRMTLRMEWGQLATHLGMSRSMLDFVRKGQRNMSFKALNRLEEVERSAGLYQPPPIVRETPPPYSAASKKDSISVKREEIREIAAALRSLCARVDQLEKRLNNEG